MTPDLIARWPGKSPDGPGGVPHPAIYHMLDVAAVCEVLLEPTALPEPVRQALTLLTALHDLGKISDTFRAAILEARPQIHGRHWQVTEALLRHHDALLAAPLGQERQQRRFMLYAASAGHHGRPPDADVRAIQTMLRFAGDQAIADAATTIRGFCALWPDASLAGMTREDIARQSWVLPGLIAAADWIGSNIDWFPARSPDLAPAEYLAMTRDQARAAVGLAGLDFPAPSDRRLFDFALRPMQQACAGATIPEGPMLAVIEDETGAGKTEAALILAQRMMLAGKGRGLFFALPTMATADAMFLRARDSIARMFSSGPSLALAHGRAGLSQGFRDLIGRGRGSPDEAGCSDWLAADRRRALLADIGVGTIDQALLAVLPTRHSCLRLFGLGSKILIVDEVHEMGDPYLAQLVAALLRVHASRGGSAILLTATLPLELRARLMRAFDEGAGRVGPVPQDAAYPALTISGAAGSGDLPCVTGPRGAVQVRRLADADAALDLLVQAAGQGAGCVWIRNAVDDAIAAVDALRQRGIRADLLHARFALVDRKRHETAALARFGKTGQGRAGRVLVSTQIMESSLDCDFDVMVSDLAPMAALIQRMGRLWRHMDLRPQSGRPVPHPVLHVVSPDPAQLRDDRWLHQVLGAGAWVYPLSLQWRTADVLFRAGRIEPPGDLRALIESTHGPDAAPVPAALQAADLRAEGQDHAAGNQARRNVMNFEDGFRQGAGDWKDTEFPTRLGQPVRTLMLVRRAGAGLQPWAGPEDRTGQMSEVQASAARLSRIALPDQAAPEVAAFTSDWPEWRKASVTVCPVNEDGTIAEGLSYDADRGLIVSFPASGDVPADGV